MRLWIWKWFLVLILIMSLQSTPCFSWRRRRQRSLRPPPRPSHACNCKTNPPTCFIEIMSSRGVVYRATGISCSTCGPTCPRMYCKKKGILKPGTIRYSKCEP